jgi:hypothetical protein
MSRRPRPSVASVVIQTPASSTRSLARRTRFIEPSAEPVSAQLVLVLRRKVRTGVQTPFAISETRPRPRRTPRVVCQRFKLKRVVLFASRPLLRKPMGFAVLAVPEFFESALRAAQLSPICFGCRFVSSRPPESQLLHSFFFAKLTPDSTRAAVNVILASEWSAWT